MIVFLIHLVLLIFGFVTGILLVFSIVKATPKTVKNYSVLLLWGALNDLVSITAELMIMERLTVLFPTCIYIPTGPCTTISPYLCNFCNSLFCNMITQSVIVQCVSFWYRLRILTQQPPKTVILNLIVAICILPNIGDMIYYNHIKSASIGDPALLSAVQTLYPHENWAAVYMYGLTNLYEPRQSISWMYFLILIPILFGYLVVTRYRVVRELNKSKSMSDKSYAMHKAFLKILTIHALLPLSIIFGLASIALIIIGFVHPALEEIIYIVGSIPPIAMPSITIYFMRPYRDFLAQHIFSNSVSRYFAKNSSKVAIQQTFTGNTRA